MKLFKPKPFAPARPHPRARTGRRANKPKNARDSSHTLVTLYGAGLCIHGYLLCPPSRVEQLALHLAASMHERAEALRITVLPLASVTRLGDGGRYVRALLVDHYPETAALLETADDLHATVFGLGADDPDNIRLCQMLPDWAVIRADPGEKRTIN